MIKVVIAVMNEDKVVETTADLLQNQPGMKDFYNFWEAVAEHSDEVTLLVRIRVYLCRSKIY